MNSMNSELTSSAIMEQGVDQTRHLDTLGGNLVLASMGGLERRVPPVTGDSTSPSTTSPITCDWELATFRKRPKQK